MSLADGVSIGSVLVSIAGVTGVLLILEAVFNYINKRQDAKNSNNVQIIAE